MKWLEIKHRGWIVYHASLCCACDNLRNKKWQGGKGGGEGCGVKGCFSLFSEGGGVKNLLPLHCDTYEFCLK